jgi:ribonucleoside-diphosphate reductase alpha chain
LFEDGQPGELFITMAKEGSTIGGLMDVIGTETSMCLQYGVPLDVLVNKFSHSRFEPSGWTSHPDIPHAKSVVDYIFRFLGMQFIPGYREHNAPQRAVETAQPEAKSQAKEDDSPGSSSATADLTTVTNGKPLSGNRPTANGHGPTAVVPDLKGPAASTLLDEGPAIRSLQFAKFQSDAPACDNCGAITVRNGNCYLCHNCGNSMGCS